MEPIKIHGANRDLHPPKGWDKDRDGECGVLSVMAVVPEHQTMRLYSAWMPNAEELAALNAGSAVILIVHGTSLPPLALGVSEGAYVVPSTHKPAMTPVELDALCSLLCCDDPCSITQEHRSALVVMADREAVAQGFSNWVAALHRHSPKGPFNPPRPAGHKPYG